MFRISYSVLRDDNARMPSRNMRPTFTILASEKFRGEKAGSSASGSWSELKPD